MVVKLEYTVTVTEKTHFERSFDEMSATLITSVASQKDQTSTNPNTCPNLVSTLWLLWFKDEGQGCESMSAGHY